MDECHNDNHAPGCQCHAGGPVMVDTPPVTTAPGTLRLQRQRDVILQTAAELISGDREDTYGSAIKDFTRTGKMWAAILGLTEVTAEEVALCMTALKIGRLCHTPDHQDSWIDACGYLALGGDIADEHGKEL